MLRRMQHRNRNTGTGIRKTQIGDLMSWATCDVCQQFLTEGDMTCTCDKEFEIECWSCENMYNGEAEHICPHCYASKKRGIRAWLKYLFLRR